MKACITKSILFCFHLFPKAKSRSIALPVDLDSQLNLLSQKNHTTMVQRAAKDWRLSARARPRKEMLGTPDYKNIIEKLQVLCMSYSVYIKKKNTPAPCV